MDINNNFDFSIIAHSFSGFYFSWYGNCSNSRRDSRKKQPNQSSTEKVYSDGIKTIRSFGTRKEFAILRFSLDKNEQTVFKKVRRCLYDRDNDKSLEMDIKEYKEISPCLYVIGNEKGYTKLNYKTSKVIQSKNINDFQEEDKVVFEKLDIIKSEAKDNQEKS